MRIDEKRKGLIIYQWDKRKIVNLLKIIPRNINHCLRNSRLVSNQYNKSTCFFKSTKWYERLLLYIRMISRDYVLIYKLIIKCNLKVIDK